MSPESDVELAAARAALSQHAAGEPLGPAMMAVLDVGVHELVLHTVVKSATRHDGAPYLALKAYVAYGQIRPITSAHTRWALWGRLSPVVGTGDTMADAVEDMCSKVPNLPLGKRLLLRTIHEWYLVPLMAICGAVLAQLAKLFT